MKCVKCEKELIVGAGMTITIDQERMACEPCFFEGVPISGSRMDSKFQEKQAKRKEWIANRVIEFSKLPVPK